MALSLRDTCDYAGSAHPFLHDKKLYAIDIPNANTVVIL